MPEPIQETAVYTVAQVAELIHSDQRLVRAAIQRGELRAFVPNGCVRGIRVLGSWVLAWIEEAAGAEA